MPRRSDASARISASRLCEISGVLRQTRDKWAQRGLLRSGEDYDELDLVELVVLNLLFATLRKSHVPIAWDHIRPSLREAVPREGMTLVWDPQRRSAAVAFDADAIVSLARQGRPVWVLELGDVVERARDAYRREVRAHTASKRGSRSLRATDSRSRGV